MAKMQNNLPPLAQYMDIGKYSPNYGDFVVWTGWITTWCGVVANYDDETKEVSIIFSCLPYLLFNFTDGEMEKHTKKLPLSQLQASSRGTFAVHQHDYTRNIGLWFI